MFLLHFYPQVPLTPLRKPDEMLVISQSQMMQGSLGYEETCEQSIPTMITWTYGGKEVAIEGSWDLWRTRFSSLFVPFHDYRFWTAAEISDTSCTSLTRTPLQRSGRDFTIMKVLPAGVYQYRFLVDGQWRYSPELPWGQDDVGNAYNVLDLQVTDNVGYARKRVELIDLEMNSCCLVNNH